MPRKKKPDRKPDRIKVGPLSAHPRKPPGKRTPSWWWQVVYYDGRTQLPALGADGKAAHRRGDPTAIRAHLNTLLEQGGWKQPEQEVMAVAELTIDQLCRLWLAEQQKRRALGQVSAQTYKNRYRWWLNHVSPALGLLPLHALTEKRLQDWVNDLSTVEVTVGGRKLKGYSPRSVRNFIRPLRGAWKWGFKKGYSPHPLPDVELPKIDGYVYNHHTPTLADAYAVVEQLSGWRRVAARLYLLTGARLGEVAGLTWSSWDREGASLTLNGKTGQRVVPTGTELQRELLEWWMRCGQPASGPLFGVQARTVHNLYDDLTTASAAAGQPFTAQGLRRLASTRLIGLGPEKVPPKEYEAAMGHSYAMGMSTYAEARPERLKAVMSHLETTG